MKNRRISMILIGILLPVAGTFSALVLEEVRIENLESAPLDKSFVRAYTSLRAGQKIENETELNEAVAHDVDNLRRSGRFSFVRAVVEQTNGKFALVYSVAGRLRLRQIEINGAEKIGNRKIRQQLKLNLGDYIDKALVGEKIRDIELYCRKHNYSDATVSWNLIEDEKTGAADLSIIVNEGAKLRVKRIVFKGGRLLDNSRIARIARFFKRLIPHGLSPEKNSTHFEAKKLRKLIKQKKTWWITSWFGAYQPEWSGADRSAIQRFYQDHGFLDVQIQEPRGQTLGKGRLELTYQITEGILYQIGRIELKGVTLFDLEKLRTQIKLLPGTVASRAAIDQAALLVSHYYGNRGYIHNRVQPRITTNPETEIADIQFVIHEGELANINEIIISGNEKTHDEVLRRELTVFPGELFHQRQIETSKNRLQNLDYFETVSTSYSPTTKTNAYDLTFKVKEKSMGTFLIGAGFSSVDSLVGFAELSHGNFDIARWPPVGAGQKMKIRIQAGSERNDLEISLIEPWFLDKKLSLGVELYRRNIGYYSDEYKLETLGGRISITKSLGPFTRGTLSYSLEQFKIYDVGESILEEIKNEKGSRSKSTLGLNLSRDTRNYFFIPTSGNYSSVATEISGGPLGADTDIYLIEAKSSQFWSLPTGHVFNLKGAISTVNSYRSDNVPIFDRLFLGGPRNIRAFAYRDISPRSKDDPNESIGGKSSWYATAEYTIPLWSKIRAAFFYDIGAVSADAFDFFSADLNSGYGIGGCFDLPMFPLRLDYAFPNITDKHNKNASPRWNFMLGYSF